MGNFRPNNGNRQDRDNRRGPSRFNNNRSERRGGFGRDRNSGRDDRRSQEMHNVTCDKCKKECQVPFKPSGNKPVLCSDCFRNNSDSRSNNPRNNNSRNQDRPSQSGISKEQFETLNKKLDKILSVLEDLELEDVEDDEEEYEEEENESEEKTETKEDKTE
jgi:CxxC-x17-CxxC domain-containing protein